MLIILIILILILIISFLLTKINTNTEDFTSAEAIKNLSTMYNNRKLTSTGLEITNDASFNNININGELRIKNKFIINTDISGNLEVYDISNNIKDKKLWTSTVFLNSKTKNIKLLEPALCDASGRYCIFPRRYYNYTPNYGADGNLYGLNTDGHMEFIAYDTDKKGNGSFDEWEQIPKNIYLTQGFAAGFKTNIKPSSWSKSAFNDIYKNLHTTWKTTDGDTIPVMFRDENNFTTAQAWDSVRYGKQAYNFNKTPEHTFSNNPYQNQSNNVNLRANLT